ncbi:hypothetical protein BDQ17DRAFT_1437533 [Cyathus striatus]|nr:hypothetical protein BDQ17DRAFT_1437533 [Cyathus striatus]
MAWTTEDQVCCECYADALLDFIEHMNDVHPPRHPGNPPSEYDYYVKHRNPRAPHLAHISYPPPRTSSVRLLLPLHRVWTTSFFRLMDSSLFFKLRHAPWSPSSLCTKKNVTSFGSLLSEVITGTPRNLTNATIDIHEDTTILGMIIEVIIAILNVPQNCIECGRDATPQPTGLTDQKEWARNDTKPVQNDKEKTRRSNALVHEAIKAVNSTVHPRSQS